ncbi:HAMP domain-containing protein [Bradyrhizobium frederickii]|uniref:HAMP domain-containing protein n=1 Tax=Bradyrhizobium frederickii TaxID=2560054 RepID=A0A4Y9NND2_9BRAD|nr:methyl-accepting chemotaxis protein [Bradyrhizobium frederickii]TFV68862.1 HAMP domain-containing protein [Bradyrhizobium frederickii]
MLKIVRSINTRILCLPVLAVIALLVAGWLAITSIGEITRYERSARARSVTEAAAKIVEMYESKAARGEMSEQAAQTAAKDAIRAIRYDGREYVAAMQADGVSIANGMFREMEGRQMADVKDSNGTAFVREMIAAAQRGGGFVYYVWPTAPNTPPIDKVAYNKLTAGWHWVVTSGVYLDAVEAAIWSSTQRIGGIVAALALVSFSLALWIGRRITRPILKLAEATHRLSDGDLSVDVPGTGQQDEVGTLAQAIAVLKQRSAEAVRLAGEQDQLKEAAAHDRQLAMRKLADGFEASIKAVADGIAAAASGMEASANSMTIAAKTTSGATSAAAVAADQTSSNVGMVAAATEELSSSIHEISRQVAHSSQIAAGAVAEAARANTTMANLANSAKRVSDIVELITGIAAQTNLLALNATIEAARAGEAGRGFAVVASEVKSLATQTAKATDEIQSMVAEIEAMTGSAVSTIEGIGGTVARMNEITATVAAAVEEQGSATQEIAGNIQHAAAGSREVSGNVSSAQKAASETGAISEDVLTAANRLSAEAERLKSEVANFLSGVRAA